MEALSRAELGAGHRHSNQPQPWREAYRSEYIVKGFQVFCQLALLDDHIVAVNGEPEVVIRVEPGDDRTLSGQDQEDTF
jgi:hypothetical protein